MDHELRSFERRARAGRDPALELRAWIEAARRGELPDASRRIVDRFARGELAREAVELAAYAGDPGALPLLEGETVEYAAFVSEDLEVVHAVWGDERLTMSGAGDWVVGLHRWGNAPVAVAHVAINRAILEYGRARGRFNPEGDMRDRIMVEALQAAEAILPEDGGEPARSALEKARDRLVQFGHGWGYGPTFRAVRFTLELAGDGRFDPEVHRKAVVDASRYLAVGDAVTAAKTAVATFALR